MKKIFNWTFGSFFRTMGRFFFYIIIGSLLMYLLKDVKISGLFNILDVYADTTTDAWVLNMQQIERGSYYNWTGADTLGSSISLTSDNFIIEWFDNHNESILYNLNYIYNTNSINVGSNGISIGGNAAQVFVSGYLYRTTLYVCATQNFSRYSSTSFVIGNNPNDLPTQSWIQLQGLNVPSALKSNIDTNINYCYAINGVVAPSSNGYNMFARITGTSNTKLYLFGYNFEVLGNITNLTSQEVQNIVSNSGLATANSITQVQSSVNQVREELADVNSSIETQTQQQHEDSQAQIDSQKVCQYIDKVNIQKDGYYLNSNGNEYQYWDFGITDYIKIDNKTEITVIETTGNTGYLCYYDINKTLISCTSNQTLTNNQTLTIPSNVDYVKFTILKSTNKPTFNICKNGNQATYDTLTDSSSPDLGSLNNSAGWLPPGPVDSILNLPLSLLNNLTINLSKNCSPVELPLPYVNRNIQLPCLNTIYSQIDGVSTWLNTIGTIASAFILFGYLINLYKYIDATLTFRENNYIDNWSGV